MMIGLALMMAVATQGSEPVLLKGACFYSAAKPIAGEVRHACSMVALTQGREADDVLVQFGGDGADLIAFAGPVSGETLTIERIYPKPGTVVAATGGHCRIFYDRDEIAGVTCVGRTPGRADVANFRTEGH